MEELLRHMVWPVSPEHECYYLHDRDACEEVFLAGRLDPEHYHLLMDLGWRRSGCLFYRPRCPDCAECTPIRVPTKTFRRSRSQRRAWRRNQDIVVTVGPPKLTGEKHAIYQRYLLHQHDGTMSPEQEDMARFLYQSPVRTLETCYWLGDRLVGAGFLDVSSSAASTVYFYFDPDCRRRSLGTFSILWEIDWAARHGIDHYYLGYLIRNLASMAYKASFRPHELLAPDGQWRPA
ncbi:MAG: arginyltransferase [Phycisphaerae bacterium]|nr:arginyltransferase [Phycisphaerae bacterium]